MRRLSLTILALAACLTTAAIPGAAPAQERQITLQEARYLAHRSLQGGDPVTARALALGLLQANPQDADALAVLAASEIALRRPAQARRAAADAFRHAPDRPLRYHSARLAASAASAQGRQLAAKYWLRRASDQAATRQEQATIAREFRVVDGRDRWERSFSFSLAPSSNLNNGSDSDLLEVDGVPITGFLSGDAQALSGLRATASARLAYRFTPRERSATKLQFQYYGTFNFLSSEARALAPAAQGSDFNFTLAEAAIIHQFLPEGMRGPFDVKLSVSQQWYGGDPLLHGYGLAVGKTMPLGERSSLRAGLSYDREFADDPAATDAQRTTLDLSWRGAVGRGGALSLSGRLTNYDAERRSNAWRGGSISARYAPGWQLGPAQVSFGLGYEYRDYPEHVAGIVVVPGGRQDHGFTAGLDLVLPDLQVMGFAPVMSFQAKKTNSNVSRYEATDLSVGLSVRSAF